MSYSFSIFLQDQASSALGRIAGGVQNLENRLNSSRTSLRNNSDQISNSIGGLKGRLELLNSQKAASTSIKELKQLQIQINQTQKEINRLDNLPPKGFLERLRGIGGQFSSLIGLAGGIGLALQAWSGVKALFNAGVAAEQASTKFEVLLGSGQKASKMLKDLTSYADKTPYSFEGLQKGAETMLGFGIAEEKILPNMKMLGDVAMGNDEKFSSLSLVYSQIMATGKLMGGDLLQLINSGFNPLQTISDKTGLSMGVLKAKMEAGAISSEMVSEAFRIATSEGGRYYGMSDKMAETAGGKFSTMMDAFSGVIRKVGLHFAEWVKPLFDVGAAFAEQIIPFGKWVLSFLPSMETFTTIMQVLGIITLTVGAYMLFTNIATIAWSISLGVLQGIMFVLEGVIWLVETAQWAWNLAMTMNPIGLVIAAIVALIAIVTLLWNKFGWFRSSVLGVWEVLKGFGTMIKDYVINRFQELLAGITGIGKALLSFIRGDFTKAIEQGKEAGENLLGVKSAKQAFDEGKKAVGEFNKGWLNGNKETPKVISNIQDTNKKVNATTKKETTKSSIFDSLLKGKPDNKKDKTKKNPAREKRDGIVAGGSRQTNITLNIEKMGTDTKIYVANKETGLSDMGSQLQEILLRAVNSVNQLQTG